MKTLEAEAAASAPHPKSGTEKMTSKDPTRRVSVVRTGHVKIRPDHVSSTWRPTYLWLLTSRHWTGPRPINAYVIEHRNGLVLFDTGQDRACDTEQDYFIGGLPELGQADIVVNLRRLPSRPIGPHDRRRRLQPARHRREANTMTSDYEAATTIASRRS